MIEEVRALGLKMGSWYAPHTTKSDDGSSRTVQRFYGWTTDREKAEAARELGAHVTNYYSRDPEFCGFDIEVREVTGFVRSA